MTDFMLKLLVGFFSTAGALGICVLLAMLMGRKKENDLLHK